MIKIEHAGYNWLCIIIDNNLGNHIHLTRCGHMFNTSTGRGEDGFLCPYKCDLTQSGNR